MLKILFHIYLKNFCSNRISIRVTYGTLCHAMNHRIFFFCLPMSQAGRHATPLFTIRFTVRDTDFYTQAFFYLILFPVFFTAFLGLAVEAKSQLGFILWFKAHSWSNFLSHSNSQTWYSVQALFKVFRHFVIEIGSLSNSFWYYSWLYCKYQYNVLVSHHLQSKNTST